MMTVVPAKARKMPAKSTAFSFLDLSVSAGRRSGFDNGTYIRQSPSTFLSGMKNMTPRVVRTVSGIFMRKIHRHESSELEDMAPPITGPMPFAIATTAPWVCLVRCYVCLYVR